MGRDPAASPDIMQRKSHSRRGADEPYLDYPGKCGEANLYSKSPSQNRRVERY